MSNLKIYPTMNEEIKKLLILDFENPLDLYAAARIEELERQVTELTANQIADEKRLYNAAAKAGVSISLGCDIPDALADKVAELTARNEEIEARASWYAKQVGTVTAMLHEQIEIRDKYLARAEQAERNFEISSKKEELRNHQLGESTKLANQAIAQRDEYQRLHGLLKNTVAVYQKEIIPGFRERAKQAEAREKIFTDNVNKCAARVISCFVRNCPGRHVCPKYKAKTEQEAKTEYQLLVEREKVLRGALLDHCNDCAKIWAIFGMNTPFKCNKEGCTTYEALAGDKEDKSNA